MMKQFLENWYNTVFDIENTLLDLNEEKASYKPLPEKWSAKEILGHLIDSALNNHRRFVLMQINPDMTFEGYDQEKWVQCHNYQAKDWSDLLETWVSLNLGIIELLEEIEDDQWQKEFKNHTLDSIAWKPLSASKPATMEYLVKDYYGHLLHHIKQMYSQTENDVTSIETAF